MASFLFAAAFLLSADSTPRHGDIVLFVGDSITQAGDYVADVEAYLLACRPSDFFRVINVGKSSETVSGTTEPGHQPPRPCIHDRFARDVAAFKPDVVVACYGMNDGNYFPWDEERFEKYKAGMTRFVDRVFKETTARSLVLLTPPPFDASRAPPPPADGKSFGYKSPSRQYDFVLRKYSEWLLTLKSDRVTVVDVHREFHLEIRERTKGKGGISFSPDGVHPNDRGHWIMAEALLREWTVRPSWRELTLDVQRPQKSLSWDKGLWRWTTPPVGPPMISLRPVITTSRHDAFREELFGQRLRVKNLPGVADVEKHLGFVFRQTYPTSAPNELMFQISDPKLPKIERNGLQGIGFATAVKERRQNISLKWLAAQRDQPFTNLRVSVESVAAAEAEETRLTEFIDKVRAPRSYEIVIFNPVKP